MGGREMTTKEQREIYNLSDKDRKYFAGSEFKDYPIKIKLLE